MELFIEGEVPSPHDWSASVHWTKRYDIVSNWATKTAVVTEVMMRQTKTPVYRGPIRVTMELRRTRLLDADNGITALKIIQDALAIKLRGQQGTVSKKTGRIHTRAPDGPNDGIEWVYKPQVKVEPRQQGVFVTVETI